MLYKFFQAIPFTFAALFPVLNPLGAAFIFLSLANDLPNNLIKKLAFKVAVNTFFLLVIVLFSGAYILRFFGITIPIVEVGGGLVVAFIGWSLLNQASKSTSNSGPIITDKNADDMAFFPLTMPITAGPGSIAVTLAISAHQINRSITTTLLAQSGAVVGMLLLAVTVFLCYYYSERLTRLMGKTGTQVTLRLAAFVNLCIGLQITWNGIADLLASLH